MAVNGPKIGIGATPELSLRVSVATLARIVFPHPDQGVPMLALEHKATLISGAAQKQVLTKAQPFGGAIRILNIPHFFSGAGPFNFDSKRSQDEQDFRIYIRPAAWDAVREYCLQHLEEDDNQNLETDPSRELEEEFEDTLGVQLRPEQYSVQPMRTVTENQPTPTSNVHAAASPTVRIYRVFNIQIHEPGLHRMMIVNSEAHTSRALQRLAIENAQRTGRGRANAILALPEDQIRAAFLATPPETRGLPLPFADTLLEGNVAVVLGDVFVPKYSALP